MLFYVWQNFNIYSVIFSIVIQTLLYPSWDEEKKLKPIKYLLQSHTLLAQGQAYGWHSANRSEGIKLN